MTRFAAGLVACALFVAVPALVEGCSSETTGPAAPDAQGGTVCPDTIAAATGQTCEPEGLRCAPQYACGIFPAIAGCVCSGGHFSCTDVTGKALEADSAPACPPVKAGGTCPASESAANLATCTPNEVGLLCAYPSSCMGVPAYDQCQCFEGRTTSGAMALRFECASACNTTDAGALAIDAPTDAPAPGDASEGAVGPEAGDAPTDRPLE